MTPIPGFDGYFATEGGQVFSSRTGSLMKLRQRLDSKRYVDLARDFGVSPPAIRAIAIRRTWNHVA